MHVNNGADDVHTVQGGMMFRGGERSARLRPVTISAHSQESPTHRIHYPSHVLVGCPSANVTARLDSFYLRATLPKAKTPRATDAMLMPPRRPVRGAADIRATSEEAVGHHAHTIVQ